MTWRRTDDNQTKVVKALRQCGFSVAITSMVGKGFVDLVIGKNGVNLLVELKDGEKPPSARKLSEDEELFHAAWRGKVIVANNIDDILKAFQ